MTELGLELSLDSRDGDDDLEDEGDGDLDQHVEFELETLGRGGGFDEVPLRCISSRRKALLAPWRRATARTAGIVALIQVAGIGWAACKR